MQTNKNGYAVAVLVVAQSVLLCVITHPYRSVTHQIVSLCPILKQEPHPEAAVSLRKMVTFVT